MKPRFDFSALIDQYKLAVINIVKRFLGRYVLIIFRLKEYFEGAEYRLFKSY
jgi:hypothetical protein